MRQDLRGTYRTEAVVRAIARMENQDLRDEVVEEPSSRDRREANPVTTKNQQVRNFATNHSVLLVASRFLHTKSPNQDSKGRDYAKAKRKTPHGTEVVFAKDPEED